MPIRPLHVALVVAIVPFAVSGIRSDAAPPVSHQQATEAMHRAVDFFRQHAASEGGGYVYQISADLQRREGEGAVDRSTAWIQPPGTPYVGMAYLQAYRLTGNQRLKQATVETGLALVRGQLESGGWDNQIMFDPQARRQYAYRVDQQKGKRNLTTLDDDKSQSAARFLMHLDKTLDFQNEPIHEAVRYALDAFVQAQYANGAWPQQFSAFPDPAEHPPRKASIPDQWPREFPRVDYKAFYTLNDNTISDMIDTMLQAYQIYNEPRYLQAARRAADFLLLAQLPAPQPGWAQQYDDQMQPVWARKFEPPAVTGGESQGVMLTLLRMYRATGDKKYLEPIPRAVKYFRSVLLPDGQLARFYELGTNRPLYFTKDYQLTYSDADMPTHYGFKVGSKLDRIEQEWNKLNSRPWKQSIDSDVDDETETPRLTDELARKAQAAIEALDERGAWVKEGRLRYQGDDDPARQVIDSRTFVENLLTLARYVAATQPDTP